MSNFFTEMKGCKFPYFMLNLTILLCYVKYRNLFKIDISWCIVFFGKTLFLNVFKKSLKLYPSSSVTFFKGCVIRNVR